MTELKSIKAAEHEVTKPEQKSAITEEHKAPTGPHISIKAEPVIDIGGFHVTNSLLLSTFVFVLFAIGALLYWRSSHAKKKNTFFYLVTYMLEELHKLFKSALGDKVTRFFPLVGAFFFFILLNNWSGLLPGVGSLLIQEPGIHEHHLVPLLRANTADLNTTIALALIAMIYIQYIGVRALGIKKYGSKFINFTSPIAFFVGILEIVSELSRILSFAFRLFGNIFAGEVLLAVVAFLVPVLASFPFLLLEVFVGFIQAVVFSMLAAVLFNLAVSEHH